MVQRLALTSVTAIALAASLALAQAQSPNGVKTLNPPGAIKAEGTWSLGARAGDFVFVAGMQGIDPATNTLVEDPQARILRAFLNIKLIAESEGPQGLRAAHRLRERPAPLRADGGEGARRAVGRPAISTPDHGRGEAPVRRRHRGDRQRLLRPSEKVSEREAPNPAPKVRESPGRLVLNWTIDNGTQTGETMLEALIIALVVGGIAGWLAGLLVQGTGFGLVGDIVVGILGALIAGFLFPALGIVLTLGGGILGAILTAFIGAVILLLIVRLIKQITA